MLVITRKIGEGVEFDVAGGIRVVVHEQRPGGRVMLRIDAPRHVRVVRIEPPELEEAQGDGE